MSTKFHSKLGSFDDLNWDFIEALSDKCWDGASRSQKDSVDGNIGRSLSKVLTEHAVLVKSSVWMCVCVYVCVHARMCARFGGGVSGVCQGCWVCEGRTYFRVWNINILVSIN